MKMSCVLAFVSVLMVAHATASPALAIAAYFEAPTFIVNQSVNGQGGWTVQDAFGNSGELFDEAIVDDGGNQVWRISNAFTAASYSNQPFSHAAPLVAGETGAGLYNDYGGDHTMPYNPPLSSATAASPYFHGAFDFKSATGAAQSGINLAISAGASQSPLRESLFQIVDSGLGFNIVFFDTTGSAFNSTTVATGLSYTDWHTIEMYIEFVDGIGPGSAGSEAGNDILRILVNGTLVHTGTTWESYFHNISDGGIPAPSARAVDSLLFRQVGTAVPANLGYGLFIDNVVVSNASFSTGIAIPEPATMTLGLLVAGALARRRRDRAGD